MKLGDQITVDSVALRGKFFIFYFFMHTDNFFFCPMAVARGVAQAQEFARLTPRPTLGEARKISLADTFGGPQAAAGETLGTRV